MKINVVTHRISGLLALVAAALILSSSGTVRAQSGAVVVANPVGNVAVPAGTAKSTVRLKKTFALEGVTGPVVRFTTVRGKIDVALTPAVAPQTVANFLKNVNAGLYTNTFFHRSNIILQGGAYNYFPDGAFQQIKDQPDVPNEFNVSNTRGTLAMVKPIVRAQNGILVTGWFFNLADTNAATYDTRDGGYTVFGHVLSPASLDVLDALAAIPTYVFGTAFLDFPLINSDGNITSSDNFAGVTSVETIQLTPKPANPTALLKLKVRGNTNPALVTPSLQGSRLILTYQPGQTGTSEITVRARYKTGGQASAVFTVTVQ